MSQLQIELDKIEENLRLLPSTVKKSRIRIAQKAAILYEILNNGTRVDGLTLPYYDHIKRYGRQRALIIEGSTSRLNPYNINPPSDWTGNSEAFSFPTNDSFIFYCFDDDGIPITFDSNSMYLIATDQGELAGRFAIGLFLRDQADQTTPDYTLSQVTVSGVAHDRVTFDTPFAEVFTIGQQFGLMSAGDNIGYIEVGVEGLTQDPTWNPFQTVDLDNSSQVDAWVSSMMILGDTDFITIAGDVVDGTIPVDDVLLSSDPNIRSASKTPYASNIEASPFFPALNADESTWPTDFDTIDVTNRKFSINNSNRWVVSPQFRWENKLITEISSVADPNLEVLPFVLLTDSYIDNLQAITISSIDWPVDDPPRTSYSLNSGDDKVVFLDTDGTTGVEPCTYNSVTDVIAEYTNNLGPLLDLILSDVSGFSDTISSANDNDATQFEGVVNQFKTLMNNAISYHNSVLSGTPVFDGTIPTYNQSALNSFFNYVSNNINVFKNRKTEIETIIGSASARTGYVGEVIGSVDVILNRSFGVNYQVYRAIKSAETITDLATLTRKKYDGLNG